MAPCVLHALTGDLLPHLNVRINGQEATALIDTGAAYNVVHADYAQTPGRSSRRIPLAANGQKMDIVGEVDATIEVNRQRTTGHFLVSPDLRVNCILGYPWLREQQANIDLQRGCMHFGRHQRVTVYWHQQASQEELAPPADARELNHDFPDAWAERFQELLNRHNTGALAPHDTG